MKIIKVIAEKDVDTGGFTVRFNENIKLKENSKLAVINASFDMLQQNVVIDETNNTLQFKRKTLNTEPWHIVTLTQGNYTQDSFIDMFNQAINSSLTPFTTSGDETNFQWKASVADNLFNLSFDRSQIIKMNTVPDNLTNNITQSTVGSSGVYFFEATGNDSATDQFDKWIQAPIPFTRGTGTMSCLIRKFDGVTKTIGIMGLLNTEPTSGIFRLQDFSYGLYASSTNYYIIYNGVASDTGHPVADTDAIKMELDEGHIYYYYEPDQIIPGSLGYPIDLNTSYTCCWGLGKKTDKIITPTYMPTAFTTTATSTDNSIVEVDKIDNSVLYKEVNLEAIPVSIVTIEFLGSLSSYLGYTKSKTSKSAVAYTFKAKTPFIDSIVPHSITIETPGLGQIESYDSVSGDRKQIIAVIPISNEVNIIGNYIYMSPYPLFIDLQNYYIQNLTNFQIRLLDSRTNEPINFNDMISLTLAFD